MTTKTLSALFDTSEDAYVAKKRLTDVGIPIETITITGGATHKERGFWESLGDMFFPEDDREAYAEGLERGGYLLTVTGLDEVEFEAAATILDQEGVVDLDQRTETWRAEGWSGEAFRTPAPVTTATTTETPTTAAGETVIPVVEERLVVGKRDTSAGLTRVRSYIVEKPVEEGVTLREQHVEVERRPADRPATEADILAADQVVEAEDRVEEAVVGKEARVVEEVVVKTGETARTKTVADTLKKTEVKVDPKAKR